MTENWLPIAGYSGRYEVSDLGRVRSLRFRSVCGPKIMRLTSNYAGYLVVSLGSKPKRQYRVNVLVLETFVGPRPSPNHDGCHGPGGQTDNRLANLRWDTKKGNCADRRSYKGETNPNAKLTDIARADLARRARAGETRKSLAVEYRVAPTRISQILREAA